MTEGEQADTQSESQVAIRLIQGYLWHPQELELDLGDWLPDSLPGNIHLLWDRLPRAPFSFFDDGTPSNTQVVYQFTVATRTYAGAEEELNGLLPGLAAQLQELLERTPAGVGWSLSDDLRPVIMP